MKNYALVVAVMAGIAASSRGQCTALSLIENRVNYWATVSPEVISTTSFLSPDLISRQTASQEIPHCGFTSSPAPSCAIESYLCDHTQEESDYDVGATLASTTIVFAPNSSANNAAQVSWNGTLFDTYTVIYGLERIASYTDGSHTSPFEVQVIPLPSAISDQTVTFEDPTDDGDDVYRANVSVNLLWQSLTASTSSDELTAECLFEARDRFVLTFVSSAVRFSDGTLEPGFQGIAYVKYSDGSPANGGLVRMGDYLSYTGDFQYSTNGDQSLFAGDRDLDTPVPLATEWLIHRSINDVFETWDGNLTRDSEASGSAPAVPTINWLDRVAFAGAMNSTIGDGLYDARADFDLDGDVDGDDLTAFNAICATWMDFNGDGGPDYFDYLDYLTAFGEGWQDPFTHAYLADSNCDGFVDTFDYLDFLDHYENGCP